MDSQLTYDLNEYVDAYRGSDDIDDGRYVIPTDWVDTHVNYRLVAAFDVLGRTVANPGPKKLKAAWLSIVREWADLVDDETKDRVLYRAKIDKRRSGRHGLIDWESYVDGPTKMVEFTIGYAKKYIIREMKALCQQTSRLRIQRWRQLGTGGFLS